MLHVSSPGVLQTQDQPVIMKADGLLEHRKMIGRKVLRKCSFMAATRPLIMMIALGAVLACSQTPKDPNPEPTEAERMSMQNECVKIADRSERQKCLDQAIFGNSF